MGNSLVRPETRSAPNTPAPDYADSLWMIRDAVRGREGLIYGKLHDNGESCAIGAFFDANPKLALQTKIIDEVATYNDSIPDTVSWKTRKRKVLEWLNWKIAVLAGDKAKPPKSA